MARRFHWLVPALTLFMTTEVRALDKQGSAHAGGVEGPSEGFAASGNVALGVALYNPSYAARPDNSGLTLLRAAAHVDLDLIGRRLSIPIDVGAFTDRRATPAGRAFVPSEVDLIAGLSSTWRAGPGAIEVAGRVEHDHAADRGGYPHVSTTASAQTYADVRTRYLFSLAEVAPWIAEALADGDVSGWATLGWFAYNESYYARPDNTGVALLRYAAHVEASFWEKRLGVAFDATAVTDRRESPVVRPSEVDITPELIFRANPYPFELHAAYERDMPVDRGGLVQQLVYLLGVMPFDIVGPEPREAEPGESVHHGRRDGTRMSQLNPR